MTPALFLDRDGVINIDHAYVVRTEDFDFVPGIFDLVRAAHRAGRPVFVVTNQAGIGRGLYTEDDFAALTRWMCARFEAEGAPIARVYHCPSHPTAGIGRYKVDSPWRKPNPGMILQARDDFGLDLARSALVGDKASDIEAGQAAGLGLNLLLGDGPAPPALNFQRVATLAEAGAALQRFWGASLHSPA
jgi:D-glycero-D-manno-heptose 1,7-bisphosphate phosphatase